MQRLPGVGRRKVVEERSVRDDGYFFLRQEELRLEPVADVAGMADDAVDHSIQFAKDLFVRLAGIVGKQIVYREDNL